jgi:hypothetical protein
MKVTWHHVALAGMALIACGGLLSLCVWAIAHGYMAPEKLFEPLGVVFGLLGALVGAYRLGRDKIPPAPPGTTWSLLPKAMATDAALSGKLPLPKQPDVTIITPADDEETQP